jgi:ATP-dependent HslUV protease subunit HslV
VEHSDFSKIYGTTIVSVRRGKTVVVAGDGQVTQGSQVIKSSAKKIRRIGDGNVIAGFAGATADAFTLLERLEANLEKYSNNLMRACIELVKGYRTDKYIRKLEAMMLVADAKNSFILTGVGDVLEPESGVMSVGSGSVFALGAARALISHTDYDAEKIALEALKIASEFCIYTNDHFTIEKIECDEVSQENTKG